MKKEFDDSGFVAKEMFLQFHDGTISLLPNRLINYFTGETFVAKEFRMHTNNQNFLVIGTIKNSDASSFRHATGCAPKKIVFQLLSAWLPKTINLTALRVDP